MISALAFGEVRESSRPAKLSASMLDWDKEVICLEGQTLLGSCTHRKLDCWGGRLFYMCHTSTSLLPLLLLELPASLLPSLDTVGCGSIGPADGGGSGSCKQGEEPRHSSLSPFVPLPSPAGGQLPQAGQGSKWVALRFEFYEQLTVFPRTRGTTLLIVTPTCI